MRNIFRQILFLFVNYNLSYGNSGLHNHRRLCGGHHVRRFAVLLDRQKHEEFFRRRRQRPLVDQRTVAIHGLLLSRNVRGMGVDRLLDGLRRRHHTAHDGRSRIRRRPAYRPALEQNGLSHRRGIHHTPLRSLDAEALHLHLPFHLDLHHRLLPLSDRQNHRSGRRDSALVQHPDTRRVLHDIRLARRPSRRGRDRRAAIHHPLRRGHHRHSARIRRSGRRPGVPRTGSGGILHALRGRIQLGVHRRVHALQPLLSGRKLGLRPAIYERAHAQRREKGRRAVRRAVYLQSDPVDAAADDLPRLRTRTFGA